MSINLAIISSYYIQRTKMDKLNIFENILEDNLNEQFLEIIKNDKVRIERIVSTGQISVDNVWYDQDENEFVILLEGHAILEFEDKECELKKGDSLNIKSHVKHRVKYTDKNGPTIWLALFY